MAISLSGYGLLVSLFQPRHLSSDPLSVLLKVTSLTLPSLDDVMFVVPLYHWYLADGCFVSHVNVCCVPDIMLIEFEFGVDFNNTRSMGTETTFVWFVNKLHQSIITKHGDSFYLCRSGVCWGVTTSVKILSVYCLHSVNRCVHTYLASNSIVC